MISRILIPLLLAILLPDLYIERRNWKSKRKAKWPLRVLRWVLSLGMMVFTIVMAGSKNFVPDSVEILNVYLICLGLLVVPKFVYVSCAIVGRVFARLRHSTTNWGKAVGYLLALFCIYVLAYGWLIGANKLNVNHVEIYSPDLPEAFDGYRIVQFTDAHVGSFVGSRAHFLERAVDTIMAQHADAIVFTGDLQNVQPAELYPCREQLSRLNARDGMFSVLGNHDYSMYFNGPEAIKVANEREMVARQRQFGWDLLLNEHRVVRRGADSIVIAGTENDGRPPFPSRADLSKALKGVGKGSFVVLLQHDPSAWERNILPHSHAQLTLSGHTHGGQISLFGLRPTIISYKQDKGLYTQGQRSLFVSSGLGGVVPFRFGVPPEVVVITLRRGKVAEK